jgi:hypothetical protein
MNSVISEGMMWCEYLVNGLENILLTTKVIAAGTYRPFEFYNDILEVERPNLKDTEDDTDQSCHCPWGMNNNQRFCYESKHVNTLGLSCVNDTKGTICHMCEEHRGQYRSTGCTFDAYETANFYRRVYSTTEYSLYEADENRFPFACFEETIYWHSGTDLKNQTVYCVLNDLNKRLIYNFNDSIFVEADSWTVRSQANSKREAMIFKNKQLLLVVDGDLVAHSKNDISKIGAIQRTVDGKFEYDISKLNAKQKDSTLWYHCKKASTDYNSDYITIKAMENSGQFSGSEYLRTSEVINLNGDQISIRHESVDLQGLFTLTSDVGSSVEQIEANAKFEVVNFRAFNITQYEETEYTTLYYEVSLKSNNEVTDDIVVTMFNEVVIDSRVMSIGKNMITITVLNEHLENINKILLTDKYDQPLAISDLTVKRISLKFDEDLSNDPNSTDDEVDDTNISDKDSTPSHTFPDIGIFFLTLLSLAVVVVCAVVGYKMFKKYQSSDYKQERLRHTILQEVEKERRLKEQANEREKLLKELTNKDIETNKMTLDDF